MDPGRCCRGRLRSDAALQTSVTPLQLLASSRPPVIGLFARHFPNFPDAPLPSAGVKCDTYLHADSESWRDDTALMDGSAVAPETTLGDAI